MFKTARLKLTIWYLVFIMTISLFFSLIIYTNVSGQIARFIDMHNNRLRLFEQRSALELPPPRPGNLPTIGIQDLQTQRRQLFFTLFFLNISILIIAGGAGYILAGRTLAPIKVSLDKQAQFVGDASHELRTPLSVLQSDLESYLMSPKITDRQARWLIKSNLEEVDRLKKLTNGLLSLTSQSSFPLRPTSLKPIIFSATRSLANLAKSKKITIKTSLNPVSVLADHHSLIQLFIILLDNAIKYSPRNSTISISTKITNHWIKVSIKDRGVGISPTDLPHIFDRFYRADKSRSKVDGFGLGLSIAQKIVTTHHGSIKVDSRPDHGSIFIVSLPLS